MRLCITCNKSAAALLDPFTPSVCAFLSLSLSHSLPGTPLFAFLIAIKRRLSCQTLTPENWIENQSSKQQGVPLCVTLRVRAASVLPFSPDDLLDVSLRHKTE